MTEMQSTTKGTVKLRDLQPAVVRPGYAAYFAYALPSGQEPVVNGRTFAHALCVQGSSDIIFTYPEGKYEQLTAMVGLLQHSGEGKAKLRVLADGELLYESNLLSAVDSAELVSLQLNGTSELRLTVDAEDDSVIAVWGEVELSIAENRRSPRATSGAYFVAAENIGVSFSEEGELVSLQLGSGGSSRYFPIKGGTMLAGCRSRLLSAASGEEPGSMTFVKRWADSISGVACTAEERFTPVGGAVRWDVSIRGDGLPWTTAVEHTVQWPASENARFWTAWGDPDGLRDGWRDPLAARPFRDLELFYGSHIFREDAPRVGFAPFHPDVFAMPLATVIEPQAGVGCSLVLSPADLILDMSLRTSAQGGIGFSRFSHRIGQERELSFTLFLVPHEPEWRGGVHWMTETFPDFFKPALSEVHQLAGSGAYSMHEGGLEVEKLTRMGFSLNWKASLDFPYMGMFLPPVDDDTLWSRFNENGWYDGDGNPDPNRKPYEKTSINRLRTYAEHMREMGFHSLSYFNVTEFGEKITGPKGGLGHPNPGTITEGRSPEDPELWKDAHDFLFLRLKDGILYWPNGFPNREGLIETWGHAIAMDPAGPSYQRFLLDQAQRHVDLLPASPGICIDRLDWLRFYNDRADDGVSWRNGGSVRSLYVSWRELMEKLGPLMHEQGKVIFCNNHVRRIDLLRHIDGIFGEFEYSGVALSLAAFCGLGMPVIGWVSGEKDFGTDPDAFMQRFLHLGVHPMVPYPANNHALNPGTDWVEQLYLDYGPLFRALKGRTWLLEPGVVQAPSTEACVNAFTAADGDWLFSVAHGKETEVELTIACAKLSLGEGEGVVEALYPGDETARTLYQGAFSDTMKLRVPLVRGCALLRLKPESSCGEAESKEGEKLL